MKTLSLSHKFYILFALILTVPASKISQSLGAYVDTLSQENFLHYLSSVGVFEAPTTVAILFLLFWLLNNCVWKFPLINKIIGIPNLNGRYEGQLVSSHVEDKQQNGTYPIVIEIRQTLISVCIYVYTERSCSYSLIANICKNYHDNYELVYVYQNKTSAIQSDSDMRDHHGTAFLEVSDEGLSLDGSYFNNPRERGRYGKVNVKRKGRKLKGKFV